MKNKKYVVSIVMLIILIVTSVGTYLCYPTIQKAIEKDSYDEWHINEYMADKMADYNYVLDLQIKSKDNPDFDINQYFEIKGQDNLSQLIEDKENFDYHVEQKQRDLKKEEDIDYQVINTKTNDKISNTDTDLNSLKDNEELQNQYQWYIQLQFDKDGKFFINFSNSEQLQNVYFYQSYMPQSDKYYSEDGEIISTLTYKNPKDLIITYAIPKTLTANGDLSSYLTSPNNSNYLSFTTPYMLIGIIFIMLIVFLTPYHLLSENKFLKFVSHIKFGILAFIWGSLVTTLFITSQYLIAATTQNLMINFYKEFAVEKAAYILTPVINIGYWFLFYGSFLILAYMLKYFFHKGLKRYFIENTILGWMMTHFKLIVNKIIDFDFNDNINKSVLRIVFFNFLIISVFCLFFVFGVFIALIYSVVIFLILKNKFTMIQEDYQVLLNSAKQLSNGNFNVSINEDIGIFNPLKDEFSHIKDGFEKAVKEEVKSQKTKTELISNVSHDLKTPLTSIITYVDLLKNPDLSKDDQEHYLQILERNSLRLKNLIEDLFEVSKANSGDIKLELIDVDIVSLIKQAQLECQDKLLEKNLELRTTYSSEKVICQLDSSKTYRIFENLFINISKYALENTRVYLELIEDDEKVIITFKNISEDEMHFNEKEIVERFVQGDKSRNTSGSGLGLAIVKSFTELQGGQFKIDIDGDLFKSIITFHK